MHTFDESERIIGRAEGQVVDETSMVNASGHKARSEQAAHFRRKNKIRTRLRVVERLDAHGITGHEQPVVMRIPEGEGEHPAKLCETLLAPARICLQKILGIGVAHKIRAYLLEFLADFAEVVDLAVVNNPVASLGIMHWLMAKGRKIKNRK